MTLNSVVAICGKQRGLFNNDEGHWLPSILALEAAITVLDTFYTSAGVQQIMAHDYLSSVSAAIQSATHHFVSTQELLTQMKKRRSSQSSVVLGTPNVWNRFFEELVTNHWKLVSPEAEGDQRLVHRYRGEQEQTDTVLRFELVLTFL